MADNLFPESARDIIESTAVLQRDISGSVRNWDRRFCRSLNRLAESFKFFMRGMMHFIAARINIRRLLLAAE